VIVSLHRNSRAAFEQSWCVMVNIMSYPSLSGSLVMKSMVIVLNGVFECSGWIGAFGTFYLFVLGFVDWQVAQPWMYDLMSSFMVGHQ
jgi:hypothetical protein